MESGLLSGKTDWMRKLYFQRQRAGGTGNEKLDRALVQLVLDHAKKVIAHPSRPLLRKIESFIDYPYAELDLEATLEESPLLSEPGDFLVEHQIEKPFSCVAMLDASSSMSGDKHLLASIAVAVLLLEVPARDNALVMFNSEAKTIKRLLIEETPEVTVLRFLKSQPRGFTNIARGLEEGLTQAKRLGSARRKVGLIATDGRSTEGGDPLEVARQFDFLLVLHLHGPGSDLDASRQMAQAGHGVCLEVERFEELPRRLYDSLRMLARM